MPVFDHLVYATPDLEATAAELTDAVGLAPAPGGSHPGMGTRNVLYGLGDGRYLEVIGPDERQGTTPRWFGIAALTRPRMAGWAVRSKNLNAVVAGARERGYDPGDILGMSRAGIDGTPLTWRLTMPKDTLVPFLIEWGDTPHPSSGDLPQLELESFAGEHPEPAVLRDALEALGVGLRVSRRPHTRLTATLAGPSGRAELH